MDGGRTEAVSVCKRQTNADGVVLVKTVQKSTRMESCAVLRCAVLLLRAPAEGSRRKTKQNRIPCDPSGRFRPATPRSASSLVLRCLFPKPSSFPFPSTPKEPLGPPTLPDVLLQVAQVVRVHARTSRSYLCYRQQGTLAMSLPDDARREKGRELVISCSLYWPILLEAGLPHPTFSVVR